MVRIGFRKSIAIAAIAVFIIALLAAPGVAETRKSYAIGSFIVNFNVSDDSKFTPIENDYKNSKIKTIFIAHAIGFRPPSDTLTIFETNNTTYNASKDASLRQLVQSNLEGAGVAGNNMTFGNATGKGRTFVIGKGWSSRLNDMFYVAFSVMDEKTLVRICVKGEETRLMIPVTTFKFVRTKPWEPESLF